jgi:hypothetical protein
MTIPIFLSYPKPHNENQQKFINELVGYLQGRGIEPRTLGVNEYDMDVPLKAIRRIMLESNGIITVAFRRIWIDRGIWRRAANLPGTAETPANEVWFTSPYCHIEPAMAFQLGLPFLILREKGVVAEGLLEKGAVGTYMPEFSVDTNPLQYLRSQEWSALVGKWEAQVRSVVDNKGMPPKLY